MDAFQRIYYGRALANRVAEHSQLLSRKWDTSIGVDEPEVLDLILALPDFKKQRAIVRAKINADRSHSR